MQTLWQDLRYGARMLMKKPGFALIVLLVATSAQASLAQERTVPSVVERIKREALQNSQVMEHAFYLSDVYGARLTGSPSFKAAGDWVVKRLKSFGFEDVRREPIHWGRSWSYSKFSVHLLEPQRAALIGSPGVWSSSTNGLASGEPILTPLPTDITEATYEKYVREYQGRLRGKVLLLSTPRPVQPEMTPFKRITDDELAQMAKATPPPDSAELPPALFAEFRKWGSKLHQLFRAEGAVALVHQSRGDGGMVVSFGPDWAREVEVELLPTVFLAAEHYNRVARLLQRNLPVRLGVELEAALHHDPDSAFNLTAELPGGAKRDEIVMIGAHLDSWTGGTGATDDAAGCAVVIEAMRILKSLELKPLRTIRLGLWGGHEGAGIGSDTYIREHFAASDVSKPASARLAAYFNLDNGGGKIRGLYLPRRDAELRPLLQSWLEPLKDLGATTLIPIGKPGGTDHAAFYNAGLLGFLFAQDPLNYRTRTRHSNLDLYDYLQEEDLKQAAVVVAAIAYQAASSEVLPLRQPLPKK